MTTGSGGAGTGGAAGRAGGGVSEGGACVAGVASSITTIMNGTVPLGTQVALSGVVATSPKFVASKGSTGACLWGLFVSEPVAQAAPYSGAILLSDGAPAVLDANGVYGACPGGTDAIPNDVLAGDVLSIHANVIAYVKSTCAGSTTPPPSAEVRLAGACDVRREARGHALPAPALVSNVAELTNAATEAVHRKWTGVLVRLDGVAGIDNPGGGPVGATGTIRLSNGVRVRDRIYQGAKTAVFAPGTTWTWIVGIEHLDVCNWAVEPRDPCLDFSPKSQNCP